jgi:PTS system galactitol-specific IIA component
VESTVRLGDETIPVLVLRGVAAGDAGELFAAVAGELAGREWVAPTFADALAERERQFPTGLDFGRFMAALPHADTEHARRSALAVVLTQAPVEFRAMDNPNRALACRLVIVPVLTDPGKQVPFLSAMTTALQRPGFYEALVDAPDEEAVRELLQRAFDRS